MTGYMLLPEAVSEQTPRLERTSGFWGGRDAGVCVKTTAGGTGCLSRFFGQQYFSNICGSCCIIEAKAIGISQQWDCQGRLSSSFFMCQNLPTLQKDP